MSDEAPMTQSNAVPLPEDVRARFNGELDKAAIVAWAEFDLDDQNRYARRYGVLTEKDLLIVADGSPTRAIPIASITEATIVEGLGVDRLNIVAVKNSSPSCVTRGGHVVKCRACNASSSDACRARRGRRKIFPRTGSRASNDARKRPSTVKSAAG
jgi:hypothetical protein